MTIDYLLSDATFESDEISIYDVNTQIEKTDTVENIRYDFDIMKLLVLILEKFQFV